MGCRRDQVRPHHQQVHTWAWTGSYWSTHWWMPMGDESGVGGCLVHEPQGWGVWQVLSCMAWGFGPTCVVGAEPMSLRGWGPSWALGLQNQILGPTCPTDAEPMRPRCRRPRRASGSWTRTPNPPMWWGPDPWVSRSPADPGSQDQGPWDCLQSGCWICEPPVLGGSSMAQTACLRSRSPPRRTHLPQRRGWRTGRQTKVHMKDMVTHWGLQRTSGARAKNREHTT